jgi:hypothetical protein
VDPLFAWSELSQWIRGSDCLCAFPTIVTLHNIGMAFLAGGGIAIDLRIIGFAPGILFLGIIFFSGHPDQYYYNNAFRLKLLFMPVAGVNLLAFYGSSAFAEAKALPAYASVPLRIKIIAGTSLFAWVAVLVCARLISFNRPPFFH